MGRKSLSKERNNNQEKKTEWVKSLIPYFQENGLKGITMDDVALHLGKSKATIYKYFQSREEIIEIGLAYKLSEIQHFEEILMNDQIPFLERYFQSVEHLTLHISDISNLFLSDLKNLYPEIWTRVATFIDYAIGIIKDYYNQGIQQGVFVDINAEMIVMSDRFFFAALSDPDFLINHQLTIKEAFRQYFNMKFFGVVKDHKLRSRFQTSK